MLAAFSSILVYPTSYTLAQNATDDSTTTEGTERTEDTAAMVRRAPDDITPPDITVPQNMIFEATSEDGAQVRYYIIAEDYADGSATLGKNGLLVQDEGGRDIIISCDPASGSVFPIGDTEVECSAEDAAGNPAEESFIITVVDTTPPDITVPSDITEEATGPDGAQVSFVVSAEDIVDGPVDVICNHNPSDRFPLGDTIVLCRATDAAHNPAEESFIITVVDAPGGGGGEVPEGGGTILPLDFLVGGGDGGTILPPGTGWVTPLVALASIVIGGIALGKYKASRGRSRRLDIHPSALVEIRSKGGISR